MDGKNSPQVETYHTYAHQSASTRTIASLFNSKQALFVLEFCHSLIFSRLCCRSEVACARGCVASAAQSLRVRVDISH